MADKANCAMGMASSYSKRNGSSYDESDLDKVLGNDVHAKAKYGQAESRLFRDIGEDIKKNIKDKSFVDIVESAGIPLTDIIGTMRNPDGILGEDIIKQIDSYYVDHLAKFPDLNAPEVFARDIKPKIQKIRAEVEGTLDPKYNHILDKYFDLHEKGGVFYGLKEPQYWPSKLARNAVGKLVAWNPLITMLNVFEILPKASAYTIEQGNPGAILSGISKFMQASGGKFWERIPELEKLGVYGIKQRGKFDKFQLLDITENPLRAISYYIGESVSPGKGREALEKIAFVHRFGNEPLMFLDAYGTDTLALMRYSVAAAKMYGVLAHRAFSERNPESIAALGAFTLMTALQTGAESAIPVPVDEALKAYFGDEYSEMLQAIDSQTPLNALKKTFNTELTEQTRPLALPALGVGFTIASQDIAGAGSAAKRGLEAAGDQDYKIATLEFMKAFMTAGMVSKIPGINISSKRALDAVLEVANGEIDNDIQSLGTEFLTKSKVYQPTDE